MPLPPPPPLSTSKHSAPGWMGTDFGGEGRGRYILNSKGSIVIEKKYAANAPGRQICEPLVDRPPLRSLEPIQKAEKPLLLPPSASLLLLCRVEVDSEARASVSLKFKRGGRFCKVHQMFRGLSQNLVE